MSFGVVCEGCCTMLGPADIGYRVCWACTRARHKAATNHGRCGCNKAARRPKIVSTRIRSWVTCERCLGTIPTKTTRSI